MGFTEIKDGIYKMNIPFDDGFTSVFVLENDGKRMLLDFAACDSDGAEYIIPAMEKSQFIPEYLVCTHNHEDHSGGIKIIVETYKDAEIAAFSNISGIDFEKVRRLEENDILLDRYKVISLSGHTADSIGLLDIKNNILLTADALQGEGIATYGPNLDNACEYLKTLKKISELKPDGIIMSHEYEPFGSVVWGGETVKEYLRICFDAVNKIILKTEENPDCTPREIADMYNSENFRKIGEWTVRGIINR